MLQQTLEVTRANVEVPWRNPATGNRGKIVVERTFYRDPQTPCRAYMRTLEVPGVPPEITRGTGCRTGTGRWLIEEEPSIAAIEPSAPSGTSRPGPAEEERTPAYAVGPDPTCPDTVMVPMPATRPPALAFTMPAKAEL
ncbi:MAG: RT0821/Lpp0805 family surface protein [Pseudomonadota bacterium]